MAATEFHTPTLTLSPPPHDGLLFWQYMLAGSLSGVVEHTSMFPIDTLKTRMQALRPSCPLNPPSLPSALRSLLLSHGLPGLYRGLSAMAIGAAPAHAVYFSVYELSKQTLPHNNPFTPALSGVCATLMNDLVFTPMDVVKQRLQLGGGEYRGVWDCVRRVLREEGFGAFYASYRTTVVMNAPYTAVHFTVYEAAKRVMSPEVECEEGAVVHATAGAAAGALAAVVTTPLDVVKTQLQCQGVCGCDRFTNGSMQDVIQTILKKDGYRGLMRGWAPRMLFHAPAAAISWSTYEAGKSFFRKMNESSSRSSTS